MLYRIRKDYFYDYFCRFRHVFERNLLIINISAKISEAFGKYF